MKDATSISIRVTTKRMLEELRRDYNDADATWDCFFADVVKYIKESLDKQSEEVDDDSE